MTHSGNKRDRVYQVSSNREKSSHKLRYVEASLPDQDDCRLCVGSLTAEASASDEFTLTRACYDDIARVAFLEKQVYSKQAYPPFFFYQALRQWPATFITIKNNDKCAGYSLLVPVSATALSLMSLLVGKQFQGKGLGRKLLSESITLAHSLGYEEIELSVSPDNASAITLYQSLGFKVTETINDYLGPGEERLLMTLSLADEFYAKPF